MQINKLSSLPIHEQIIDDIKKQISDGILAPGNRLLSVRELATSLQINPNIVNRAYKSLEKEGYIVILYGKGIFIKNIKDIPVSITKEKELKLELELHLLELYYQNVSRESVETWINEFYQRVVKD